jgi:hypothetical protein
VKRWLPTLLLLACDKGGQAPAPTAQLDPETNVRVVNEMELRCKRGTGDRGQACLVAGSAYEFGGNGIEKDTAHAGQIYGWACKWGASTLGHDLKWFCAQAERLGGAAPTDAGAATAPADAGP